jgi:chromosome transmission fidelity protein 4
MGNGPVGGDGSTKLLYSIENVKRDERCQSDDLVALPDGAKVLSVFFSDNGDPCIYDSTGVLLILQHWRTPGQAKWVPILDTKSLSRLAGGRKEETYWPVAVAQEKFHCIILKGGDRYPYFPKPLLSEFDFKIPCSTSTRSEENPEEPTANEVPKLEESFVRNSLLLSLFEDLITSTHATYDQRAELTRREIEFDKSLLQLLNVECRVGEERGMKALELVRLMKDRNGKMVEAAAKVAGRYGRTILQEKIGEFAEKKLNGMVDDDDVGVS